MSSKKPAGAPEIKLEIERELEQLHIRLSTIDHLIRSLEKYEKLQPKPVPFRKTKPGTT